MRTLPASMNSGKSGLGPQLPVILSLIEREWSATKGTPSSNLPEHVLLRTAHHALGALQDLISREA